MKAVLISIQPKWCELIARFKKLVEVRKTKPKLDVPFKCYIYCTKDKHGWFDFLKKERLDGKVIGEFVCNKIITDKSFGHNVLLKTEACLSDADAATYCVNKEMYGWHISNLVIYDKPKELSEFNHCGVNYHYNPPITRPPQSWCYVESLQDNDNPSVTA